MRTDRLRVSPNFNVAFALDGRAYVAKETEPYIQYWLTERDRLLHAIFAGRRGATAQQAVDAYFRLTGDAASEPRRARLSRAIREMREAGVLVGTGDDTSRYDARIVDAYLTHRPFPRELSEFVIGAAPVRSSSKVLDIAGGPGDLALALAEASRDVSLMDLSRGFLAAAARRARAAGRPLTTIHDSGNRLVFRDDTFDVITIAQALHWLDDVQLCRGVCRALRAGGSFFVVHAAMEVDSDHPLASLFGTQSVLGPKTPQPFRDEVQPMLRRLTLLFEALDGAAGIVPVNTTLFVQQRPFDLGFAQAFLTDEHLLAAGLVPERFWPDIVARCADAPPDAFVGTQHWAVLHFQRGATAFDATTLASAEPIVLKAQGSRLKAQGPRLKAQGSRPKAQGSRPKAQS